MMLKVIVRGRYVESSKVNDLSAIEVNYSVKAQAWNAATGALVSANDSTSVVGHYVIETD